MIFTEKDLETLSSLARIDIREEEKEKMLHDMQAILGYISEINTVSGNIGGIKHSRFNIVREDVAIPSSSETLDIIMKNAPKTSEGYLEVMQVLK